MVDLIRALVSDAVLVAPHDADLVVQQPHALSQLLRPHLRAANECTRPREAGKKDTAATEWIQRYSFRPFPTHDSARVAPKSADTVRNVAAKGRGRAPIGDWLVPVGVLCAKY